jgi:hypothetical protein
MRSISKKTQFLVPAILLTACLALVAATTVTPVSAAEKTPKCSEVGQGQAQRMCPPAATPTTGLCAVNTDCSATQTPGKMVCQPASDCAPAKPAGPAKGKQKK